MHMSIIKRAHTHDNNNDILWHKYQGPDIVYSHVTKIYIAMKYPNLGELHGFYWKDQKEKETLLSSLDRIIATISL